MLNLLERQQFFTLNEGFESQQIFCRKLKRPRRVMLLVKAGSAVQSTIDGLVPHLEKGDIIIDGGNSEYHDSNVKCFDLHGFGITLVQF